MSGGFARGRVFVYRTYLPDVPEHVLEPGELDREVGRLREAVSHAGTDLAELRERVRRDMGREFAEFIDVQLALLNDEDVLRRAEEFIRSHLRNAEFAYSEAIRHATGVVLSSEMPLLRERGLDLADVSGRVLSRLLGEELPSIHGVGGGAIVVAHDLPPSEAALLDPARVAGVVLEAGGKTSHTAIMTKAKEIPAVVGVESLLRTVQDGEDIFVDGYRGLAVVTPGQNRLEAYSVEVERERLHRESLRATVEQEPVTLDGKMIDLSANVEFMVEAKMARQNGARGVGLFRTEYMYLARRRPPTEQEQFEIIAEVAQLLRPYPVIVRTFDLGGDKVVPGYSEANPFLGWRAIRMCFDNIQFFRAQLRAIARASAHGNVKVMFPMVATIDEFRRARLLVEDVKRELHSEGESFDERLEVGVMVEIPSAALMADILAKECRFLSIGSNDLTQYALAVDRANERVAKLFDHLHPAVLQLIKRTIDAAHRQGIWVGVCGEIGSDPLGVLLLLGMGIDEISVTPAMVPEVKNIIRSIDTAVAADVAAHAVRLGTALEVHRLLRREVHRRFPILEAALSSPGKEEVLRGD